MAEELAGPLRTLRAALLALDPSLDRLEANPEIRAARWWAALQALVGCAERLRAVANDLKLGRGLEPEGWRALLAEWQARALALKSGAVKPHEGQLWLEWSFEVADGARGTCWIPLVGEAGPVSSQKTALLALIRGVGDLQRQGDALAGAVEAFVAPPRGAGALASAPLTASAAPLTASAALPTASNASASAPASPPAWAAPAPAPPAERARPAPWRARPRREVWVVAEDLAAPLRTLRAALLVLEPSLDRLEANPVIRAARWWAALQELVGCAERLWAVANDLKLGRGLEAEGWRALLAEWQARALSLKTGAVKLQETEISLEWSFEVADGERGTCWIPLRGEAGLDALQKSEILNLIRWVGELRRLGDALARALEAFVASPRAAVAGAPVPATAPPAPALEPAASASAPPTEPARPAPAGPSRRGSVFPTVTPRRRPARPPGGPGRGGR